MAAVVSISGPNVLAREWKDLPMSGKAGGASASSADITEQKYPPWTLLSFNVLADGLAQNGGLVFCGVLFTFCSVYCMCCWQLCRCLHYASCMLCDVQHCQHCAAGCFELLARVLYGSCTLYFYIAVPVVD